MPGQRIDARFVEPHPGGRGQLDEVPVVRVSEHRLVDRDLEHPAKAEHDQQRNEEALEGIPWATRGGSLGRWLRSFHYRTTRGAGAAGTGCAPSATMSM